MGFVVIMMFIEQVGSSLVRNGGDWKVRDEGRSGLLRLGCSCLFMRGFLWNGS